MKKLKLILFLMAVVSISSCDFTQKKIEKRIIKQVDSQIQMVDTLANKQIQEVDTLGNKNIDK